MGADRNMQVKNEVVEFLGVKERSPQAEAHFQRLPTVHTHKPTQNDPDAQSTAETGVTGTTKSLKKAEHDKREGE